MIFANLFKTKSIDETEQKRVTITRNLMRREAKIGGQLFGPLPKGGRREFFCLDEHTWIWHEEWLNKSGERKIRTTRYNVRPDTILKAQDDSGYHQVSLEEGQHLAAAAKLYSERVQELYNSTISH